MSLSAEDEQRLIDKAVETHSKAILALKYQRNSLASISRLPAEILSQIFSFVKLSLTGGIYSRFTNSLAWIKITHVSTHWRYVAMNSPTLWDNPPPENGQWLVEMLKRSKMAGLNIHADLASRVPLKMVGLKKILQYHGSRIQHLTLTNMTFDSRKVLEDLPASAPRLETLRLAASLPDHANWDDVCIPKTFLTNSGNLRRLELSGCNVHWNLFSLSNITHLKLHDITKLARPTWTQFMGALAEMFKLECLDLKYVLDPTIKFTADTPSDLIQLSRLQMLTMTSPIAEVEMFFRHVAFPPSATVHVRAIPSSASISNISAVISSISRSYLGQEFLTLTIRDSESYHFTFVQFRLFRKATENPVFYTNAAALTLEIVTSGIQVTAEQIVPELFNNGFPLNTISHVELDANITKPDTLTCTLGNLPALSFVWVHTQSGIAFVKALYPHSNAVDAEYFPLYFRNLVTINLSLTFEAKDGYAEKTPFDVDLKLLQDCLIQRYECGAEIQKLSLDDCFHLEESDVLELTDIVTDVDWDAMEQVVEPSEEEEEEYGEDEEDDYYDSDDRCHYQ
ncbi:hypothetical protein HYPSUDRAFT_792213 [Hypholoma sublateritium FD-334 SS-4]|uniref:Uncharacterized protein n=1 Tax=Hypholoma sublateritium (strain FD-334 SS-4) TaxID=945553 RepID=A0A0D2MVH1_HYPSF|nr:hypothetical protein HYPSUDRAFT_792213 [Hypholoma sublateritium FD-334 SS-4]